MGNLSPKQKYYENVANTIIKNLSKRQIEGFYCSDSKSAVKKALELMPKGSSISWGRFNDSYRNRSDGCR